MQRRRFLAQGGLLAAAALVAARGQASNAGERPAFDPLSPLWEAWKKIHLAPTGRVIDRLQGGISHSEGQGYGLLIAEAVGDQKAFDLILGWSMARLAVRETDKLLAWRWSPADGGTVTDRNNASDGDLFFAWALARGARTFGQGRYLDIAQTIAADLVSECIRPCPARPGCLILLPGQTGFADDGGVIVNPAYYMVRAMEELAGATGQPALRQAAADGVSLLATLARDSLIPDWVRITANGPEPAANKSDAFGYEAMRVPLYLYWSNLQGHPAVARAAAAYKTHFANAAAPIPVVIDRATEAVQDTSVDPGYQALAALAACAHGSGTGQLMPAFKADQSYYPATLHLLALLAQRESQFRCTV